ncbi:unnamed protein product [Ectocarpus sp. CCAP 1310/34]|nr:unnamed protein product [Ectocarpus sp. CCAP 1310/34]
MRYAIGLCAAALPFVRSFTMGPAAYRSVIPAAASCQKECSGGSNQQQASYGTRRISSERRRLTRRYAGEGGGGSANMDPSDDTSEGDAEMYASLRKRLEELENRVETSAPAAQEEQGQEPAVTANNRGAREREWFTIPKEAPEDKRRSLALLTIQSVGVISAALSFGTLALYWLAGAAFVHLGPREYPGSVSSRGSAGTAPGFERIVVGEDENGGAQQVPQTQGRAMGGSSTREAFQFEGFPDVGGGGSGGGSGVGKGVVPPDF